MEVLLEVGRFDIDGGVELTMIHTYIDIQKCDFGGGGVPGELDGIAAVEAFKELGEGVGSMGLKKENVIDETQPEALSNPPTYSNTSIFPAATPHPPNAPFPTIWPSGGGVSAAT